eukprot:TRINITY_DN186_c0_g2_i2.p1 TRINITY_DN186_c0_g2~~TRINITY_DN186_c0_g2_i2.p1  ORF type:complete len:4464 (+),score=1326.13 TRINITY_DN186_c0_g2_i2:41-13432(+)
MAALDSRHRWVVARLADVLNLDAVVVETALSAADALTELDMFMKPEGPQKLVFSCQLETESKLKISLLDSNVDNVGGRGVYFVRISPKGITAATIDVDVVFGVVDASALRSLHVVMNEVFLPVLQSRADWGQAGIEGSKEFLSSMRKFVDGLREAVVSIDSSISLRKPDPQFVIDPKPASVVAGAKNDELAKHYEEILDDWINQTEVLLADADAPRQVRDDDGPDTELDFWRKRMAKFTAITEQLKSRECKAVLGLLNQRKQGALRRWRTLDNAITDAANEAKDNVKFLASLEKHTETLYTGTPLTIGSELKELLKALKMMHSVAVARHYGSAERMTTLLVKVTNQMIKNCRAYVTVEGKTLWEQDPAVVAQKLLECNQLLDLYQEQFRSLRDKALAAGKGRPLDLSELHIFGKFELFCKRGSKLIDVFTTIRQFRSLADHNIDGMDVLIRAFEKVTSELRAKKYDLLDYTNPQFDKDYVEFNKAIQELESALHSLIGASFESIKNTEHSLSLLKKFQTILQRDALKADLDSKMMDIFHRYGLDLEGVQRLYEQHRDSPPIVRNYPPVAGNILWARMLFRRIDDPMKRFKANDAVMATKESKKIMHTYKRVASALKMFEQVWLQAWEKSVEEAKAGLQATLIVRHPADQKLYVNFDGEILQLIREAKCLERLRVRIPDGARMVLLQEDKYKQYYDQLTYVLREHERLVMRVPPMCRAVLKPHLVELERRLQPGMSTLTWTSMNIDGFLHRVHQCLSRFGELIDKINDITQNRIDSTLRTIARNVLVDLPEDRAYKIDEFVASQERTIRARAQFIDVKNQEVEAAVKDLIQLILAFPFSTSDLRVPERDLGALRRNFADSTYRSILGAISSSLNVIKGRIGSRTTTNLRPFFDVDVELSIPDVVLSPSLEEIQEGLNQVALAVLRSSKGMFLWGQTERAYGQSESYFSLIASDPAIIRVILLLTGSIESIRRQVVEYLSSFKRHDFLWRQDLQSAYTTFMATNPTLEEFEHELKRLAEVESQVAAIQATHNIGALRLETGSLKNSLKAEASNWKAQYANKWHEDALRRLRELQEEMSIATKALSIEIVELDDLKSVMDKLREIRENDADIDMRFAPVIDTYALLLKYDACVIKREEVDSVGELRHNWAALKRRATSKSDELGSLQVKFKKDLVRKIQDFRVDVLQFRNDYDANGAMARGLSPDEAIVRLNKYQTLFEERNRKRRMFNQGEELFGLPQREYPELQKTDDELTMLNALYSLYQNVLSAGDHWRHTLWVDLDVAAMNTNIEDLHKQSEVLPKQCAEFEAYNLLRVRLAELRKAMPVIEALHSEAIAPRHWGDVMKLVGRSWKIDSGSLKAEDLLQPDVLSHADEVLDIARAAAQEADIERKLKAIADMWQEQTLQFGQFKQRGFVTLKVAALAETLETLDDSQVRLASMLASRHVNVFRDAVQSWQSKLGTVAETLELWLKVQGMWSYLEDVFSGGDIVKQLPQEAKRFAMIDKKWVKIMQKAVETQKVVAACVGDDAPRDMLAHLKEQLDLAQKSLASYLEKKRTQFPRLYFVADAALLDLLSQSSDPMAVEPHLNAMFDNINSLEMDRVDRTKIAAIISAEGERLQLSQPVSAKGSPESWLIALEAEMRRTLKDVVRKANMDAMQMPFYDFVQGTAAQVSLLGLALIWTREVEAALAKATKDRTALPVAGKHALQLLSTLAGHAVNEDANSLKHIKLEALVTLAMHHRDVIDRLILAKPREPTDFAWQRHCRTYWRQEQDECIVSICDIDFPYCYEYLGARSRLIITSLTERAYVALTQALGLYQGGAPSGPAGTGKTETVKDIGRTLGLLVLVFNCSEQTTPETTSRLIKGLSQTGAWACFDEFNRIRREVLSVTAQQMSAIFNILRQKGRNCTFVDGSVLKLHPACGMFITMNPSYAGRHELPENVKALFRTVAMNMPDRRAIIAAKLAIAGFNDEQLLARKVDAVFRLCEEQLPAQPHYDFGLRGILAALRSAAATRRGAIEGSNELQLLVRVLCDSIMPRLAGDDVPLFLALLDDVFPNAYVEVPNVGLADIEAAVARAAQDEGLQSHRPWLKKAMQLYEASTVRHGLIVIGPAASGKTTALTMLTRALTNVLGPALNRTFKVVRMNPKAITSATMFGQNIGNNWVDGIFTDLWRKARKTARKINTWIVVDGPVDTVWVENLNTVLDDNKLLTLPNGDRLPMEPTMRLVIETDSLTNASPATVSRVAVVYMSADVLGWQPVVETWLTTRTSREQQLLRPLLNKHVGNLLAHVRKNCKFVIDNCDVARINSVAQFLEAMLKEAVIAIGDLSDIHTERIFWSSMTWGIGGACTRQDRVFVDTYVRQNAGSALPEMTRDETVFDFYVDADSSEWENWQAKMSSLQTITNVPVPFVQTVDSVRLHVMSALLLRNNSPVLVVGDAGVGKTATLNDMLNNTAQEDPPMFKRVRLGQSSSAFQLQQIIEGQVHKLQGKSFGPPTGRRLVMFIDDVNVPMPDPYGAVGSAELLRQLIEDDGCYAVDGADPGTWYTLERVQYLAATRQPYASVATLPARLKRHFTMLNLPLPSRATLDMMVGTIAKKLLDPKGMKDVVQATATLIAEVTVLLFEKLSNALRPVAGKMHYTFSLREVTAVARGMLLMTREVACASERNLLALWRHEVDRVYGDRLVASEDRTVLNQILNDLTTAKFPKGSQDLFFTLLSPPVPVDADPKPRKCDALENLDQVRAKVTTCITQLTEVGLKPPQLVLFDSALQALLRMARVLALPAGNLLVVGGDGTGRHQSVKLAALLVGHRFHHVSVANRNAFADDFKALYKQAAVNNKPATILVSIGEAADDAVLDVAAAYVGSGEAPSIFEPEEVDVLVSELISAARRSAQHPADATEAARKLLVERARDNLRFAVCVAPGPAFLSLCRRFPALVSESTVQWSGIWPRAALSAVATADLADFAVVGDASIKANLVQMMVDVHAAAENVSNSLGRNAIAMTPSSFRCLLQSFKSIYTEKFTEQQRLADDLVAGLQTLNEASQAVVGLQTELKDKEISLQQAEIESSRLLETITTATTRAEKKRTEVMSVRTKLASEQQRIAGEHAIAQADLAQAEPALKRAAEALNLIQPRDISVIKQYKVPPPLVKLILDAVMVLQMRSGLEPVTIEHTNNPKLGPNGDVLKASWDRALQMAVDAQFLPSLIHFTSDMMTDETVELLQPYLSIPIFNFDDACKASNAAAGLCGWVIGMVTYYETYKQVRPKIDELKVQQARLNGANARLAAAEDELMACEAELARVKGQFDAATQHRQEIQDSAEQCQKRMDRARALLTGLGGERQRWTAHIERIADVKKQLVGDAAQAAAFIAYCGPFDDDLRKKLMDSFRAAGNARSVPSSPQFQLIPFLVEDATIMDWTLQGLPNDNHSVESAVIVSRTPRWPLLIDPQELGADWLSASQASKNIGVTTPSDRHFRVHLEACVTGGRPLLVTNILESIPTAIDGVLRRAITPTGRGGLRVNIGEHEVEFSQQFKMFLSTRTPPSALPTPLLAHASVVDFTVASASLEAQLLAKVVRNERPDLEDQRQQLLAEIASNKHAVRNLEKQTLHLLTEKSQISLVDNTALIDTLSRTKALEQEAKDKLTEAANTEKVLNDTREKFRAIAVRGAAVYGVIADLANVSPMYQTSLTRFLVVFHGALRDAPRAAIIEKRVEGIVEQLTYSAFKHISRGLFERHRRMFGLLLAARIQLRERRIMTEEFNVLIRGGAALDEGSVRRKPAEWIQTPTWLNIMAAAGAVENFKDLPEHISRNDTMWRPWADNDAPETIPLPDNLDARFSPFQRLLLIRSLRPDRFLAASSEYIVTTLGKRYGDPLAVNWESLTAESTPSTPVLCLLGAGADPSSEIEQLSKRIKKAMRVIALGDPDDTILARALSSAATTGSWLLLQNCHLGPTSMSLVDAFLESLPDDTDSQFRLWLTSEPDPRLPSSLIQRAIKLTTEPPGGLRSALARTVEWLGDEGLFDAMNSQAWRGSVFATAFLHCAIQERKRFGPLGWNASYEFSLQDMQASLTFLQNHMTLQETINRRGPQIIWPTVRFMMCDIFYGGRITTAQDQRVLDAYGARWLTDGVLKPGFVFHEPYKVSGATDIQAALADVQKLPWEDPSELFGFFSNADVASRAAQAQDMLATVMALQPRAAAVSGGRTREALLSEQADEVMGKLPPVVEAEEITKKLEKLGARRPLLVVLRQEVDRLQVLVRMVRKTLQDLKLSLVGAIGSTPQLADAALAIQEARVPPEWQAASWTLPTLGLWLQRVAAHHEQLNIWLEKGKPITYQLACFFNPQGFLTAVQQEARRKNTGWMLDDLVLVAQVRKDERLRAGPDDGVYLTGLVLAGAAWDTKTDMLTAPKPKELFCPMPIVWMTAMPSNDRLRMFADRKCYSCPCYTSPQRTQLVFEADLPTEVPADTWVLAGAALLCSRD